MVHYMVHSNVHYLGEQQQLLELIDVPVDLPVKYQRHQQRLHLGRRHLWCHATRYVRHARGGYAYGVRTVGQQLPCAAGTYSTREAGAWSPYVRYRGPGTYVSAQAGTLSSVAMKPMRMRV